LPFSGAVKKYRRANFGVAPVIAFGRNTVLRAGIDLGGTKTEGVVLNANGEELEQQTGAISVIGVGMPGSVSSVSGLVRNANTTSLIGKRFADDLAAVLGRQVRLSNDANCFALAEAHVGAGRGHSRVFGVIMGTGVGGGIVINGEVINGRLGISGEWGHNPLVTIDDEHTIQNAPRCYCGRRGCVETWLSGPALVSAYARNGGAPSIDGRPVAAIEVVQRAAAEEPVAMQTMDRFIEHFGRAMASVINIVDPDIVVLGGGLSNVERLYSDGRAAIEPHVFSDYFDTPLVPAQGGDSAGVVGAAWLWTAQEAAS